MNTINMTSLLCVDPLAAERAARLEFAISLLRNKRPVREARRRVQQRFQCSQPTAWRTVEMARDLV